VAGAPVGGEMLERGLENEMGALSGHVQKRLATMEMCFDIVPKR
jgi:hypothetical protein